MDDADREKELAQSYRAEAIAFFQVNQTARTASERVMALMLTVVGLAVVAGVNEDTWDTAIALPPLVLLMLAFMFQQYADLTVLGMARKELERRYAALLGGEYGLIYETAVAEVRRTSSRRYSMRLLQIVTGLLVTGVLAVGTVEAWRDQPLRLSLGYTVLTALAAVAAGWSFWHMDRALDDAPDEIRDLIPKPGAGDPVDPSPSDLG